MKGVLLILFSVSLPACCYSQNTSDTIVTDGTMDSLHSVKQEPKTVQTVAIAAGYTGVTFLCYRYCDAGIQHFAQANHSGAVSSFAKIYEYTGMGTSSIVITAATAVTSIITKDKKLQKTAILLAGGHVLNDLVTNQFKITFQRHRPNTGDPYNSFDWRGGPNINKSFISSHTSNAFATATAFATVYSDKKWVPVVAYSAASLVGLCRIYNNAHWASDVMGGAAIGFASVKCVNTLYKIAAKNVTFIPQVNNGHYAATMICLLGR